MAEPRQKKTIKRINQLIQDIDRNCNEGLGKPENLKIIYQDGGQGELMTLIVLYTVLRMA